MNKRMDRNQETLEKRKKGKILFRDANTSQTF